jgi:hypothetical protein
MLATFQNSGFVLSIGIFFSLMIAGLASTLPTTLTNGLTAHGVPHAIAHEIGQAPPVASLFAAFLGYNPVHQLLSPTGVLAHLPADQVSVLTGKQFFPELISGPFHHGLVIVFSTAIVLLVIAAGVSLLRGGRYVYEEHAAAAPATAGQAAANGAHPAVTAADGQPPRRAARQLPGHRHGAHRLPGPLRCGGWRLGADQGGDGRVAAQLVQASAAGGPDAPDGDAEARADLGIGQRRVLDQQREQLLAAGGQAGKSLAQRRAALGRQQAGVGRLGPRVGDGAGINVPPGGWR